MTWLFNGTRVSNRFLLAALGTMMVLSPITSFAEYITPNVSGCLNFRTSPRSGAVKQCLSSGTKLEVVNSRGNWVQVNNGSSTGWIYRPMTRTTAAPTISYITPTVRSCLNVRSAPGRNNSRRSCLKSGTPLQKLDQRGGWVKVKTPSGKIGWVSGNFTKASNGEDKSNVNSGSNDSDNGNTASIIGDASAWKTRVSNSGSLTCSKYDTNPLKCLACNAHFEGGIEPAEGRKAVSYVVFNRVTSRHYPNDVCKVIYQRKQFSWANSGSKRIRGRDFNKMQAEQVKILNQYLNGNLSGNNVGKCATHYVNPAIASRASLAWRRQMTNVGRIKRHTFYRMRGHKCFDGTGPGYVRLANLTKARTPRYTSSSSRNVATTGGER